jgi:hypothetical protein
MLGFAAAGRAGVPRPPPRGRGHEVVRARAQDPPLTGNHEVAVRYIILAERKFPEVTMRIGTVLIIVWLVIGAIAGAQRHRPEPESHVYGQINEKIILQNGLW